MSTAVQQYIAKRREPDQGDIRVTVRLGQQPYARLVQLSDKLGMAKTTLAGDLLEAAISDASKELDALELPSKKAMTREERGAPISAAALDKSSKARADLTHMSRVSAANTWIFQANPKSYDLEGVRKLSKTLFGGRREVARSLRRRRYAHLD
jgi:hypothetical protein